MKKHIKDFDISSAQHSELSFYIKDKKDEKLKQKKSFYFQHSASHRLKNIIAIFLIFTMSNCIAQLDSIKTLDYSLADSIALNFHKKRYKSVRLITSDLTRGLKNEYDIYRVIFRWITDNIKYCVAFIGFSKTNYLFKIVHLQFHLKQIYHLKSKLQFQYQVKFLI